jgi:hypothetical protein
MGFHRKSCQTRNEMSGAEGGAHGGEWVQEACKGSMVLHCRLFWCECRLSRLRSLWERHVGIRVCTITRPGTSDGDGEAQLNFLFGQTNSTFSYVSN